MHRERDIVYVCDVCNESFTTEAACQKHEAEAHGMLLYCYLQYDSNSGHFMFSGQHVLSVEPPDVIDRLDDDIIATGYGKDIGVVFDDCLKRFVEHCQSERDFYSKAIKNAKKYAERRELEIATAIKEANHV